VSTDPGPHAEVHDEGASSRRFRVPLWARLLFTAGTIGLWYAVAGDTVGHLGRSIAKMPAWALGAAIALHAALYLPGAHRWKLLMRAYGGERLPSMGRLYHLLLVGQFYNTFLPANLGGDVLRGHWTRRIVPSGGAYLVVLVERLFALSGLLVVVSVGLVLEPRLEPIQWVGIIGVIIALAILVVVGFARRIGRRLEGEVGRRLRQLPPLAHRGPLPMVFLLSIIIHVFQAMMGYVLFAGLGLRPGLIDVLVLVPVALAALYLPTIAGLGARETAFVLLFRPLGIGAAEATTVSLGMLGAQLAVAGIGGLLQVIGRPVLRGAT
jgi:uncharacterized membrane protein YbhN (UPF0104 family)